MHRQMWLLSTARAELHFFATTAAITGGYAILSHTWSTHEDSFEDLRLLRERCSSTSANPRDVVSPKIRHCCLLAESHGYQWVWIDSCCIDKTSSSELSEALNSMFRWYSQAEVCYAFLEDVSSTCALSAQDSEFRKSRYHTRGWTLQELVAPQLLIFLSREWRQLCVKSELAGLLEEITGVSRKVLTGESHFSKYSLAVRMSWASGRSTTRVEDEAYCLMGLFGVSMPTLYGEGRQAFQRLQCEIVQQSVDTSLFAWGRTVSQAEVNDYTSHHTDRAANFFNHVQYLFAPSPSSFKEGCVYYTPRLKRPLQPYLPWQLKKAAKVIICHDAFSICSPEPLNSAATTDKCSAAENIRLDITPSHDSLSPTMEPSAIFRSLKPMASPSLSCYARNAASISDCFSTSPATRFKIPRGRSTSLVTLSTARTGAESACV